MPNYFARANGNINATNVWATTPTGTAGAQTFVAGDVLYANSFTITVNVDTNLGSAGEVRNDNTNGATAGGSFTLSNGVTLTANVFAGSAATACVTFAGAAGNSATIVGNCRGGSTDSAHGCSNTSTGTLNVTGDCAGGSSTSGVAIAGANNNSSGVLTITGNCVGGTGTGGNNIGANNAAGGVLNITGNCTGGPNFVSSFGARNGGAGTLSITGNCTAGSTVGSAGAANNSTGTMIVTGSIFASEHGAGVGGTNRGQVTRLTGPFFTSSTFGVNPIGCVAWRWDTALSNTTYIQVPTQNLATTRNLVTPDNATNFPAASNVRSGISYGISGALTGTCAVPPAASVATGVPVDNTVGTAALTPADFWNAQTSGMTASGSIGARLRNAATVDTTGQALADALSPTP